MDKGRIVQEFRNRCPDALLPWIDATVVLADQQPYFPPLLGTGGNDGRLDFSTNFHERLLEVLDVSAKGRARSLALRAGPAGRHRDGAAGQRGRSASSTRRWRAARHPRRSARRHRWSTRGSMSCSSKARCCSRPGPRAGTSTTSGGPPGRSRSHSRPTGSASGAAGEESRGEVWVPVWSRPCTLAEIRQLFGEARASWRGRPAQQAVEFYAATRTLGVARGIDEFVRYGLQRRNGLAFVAVPLDRVQVREPPGGAPGRAGRGLGHAGQERRRRRRRSAPPPGCSTRRTWRMRATAGRMRCVTCWPR